MRTLARRKDAGDDRRESSTDSRIDSASVRWVFAATLAFWLVVFAVGHALF